MTQHLSGSRGSHTQLYAAVRSYSVEVVQLDLDITPVIVLGELDVVISHVCEVSWCLPR